MILEMVADGTITSEEGARLLKALDERTQAGTPCCGGSGYLLITTADDLPQGCAIPTPPMPPDAPGAPRMIVFRGERLDDGPDVVAM